MNTYLWKIRNAVLGKVFECGGKGCGATPEVEKSIPKEVWAKFGQPREPVK